MKALICSLIVAFLPLMVFSQNGQPIIDMHLHAHRVADFSGLVSPPPIPHCIPMTAYQIPEPGVSWREIFQNPDPPCDAIWSPMNDEELLTRTFELLDKHNIVKAVTSGPLTGRWTEQFQGRIIPALHYSPVHGHHPWILFAHGSQKVNLPFWVK